jgi:hypothetical protein
MTFIDGSVVNANASRACHSHRRSSSGARKAQVDRAFRFHMVRRMDVEHFTTASVGDESSVTPLTDQQRRELASRAGSARLASAQAAVRHAKSVGVEDATNERAVATRAVLRSSIGEYVVLLRQLDTPPERMLSLVKSLVRESVASVIDQQETRLLLQSVVVWCVEAYYGTTMDRQA